MSTTTADVTPSAPRFPLFVVQSGLVTTALALFGTWYLESHYDENVMGWYGDFIPVGALLVGLLAASGYGIASYYTGVKIRRATLLVVVLLQIGTYFTAQYIEFYEQGPLEHRGTGRRVSFWEYYSFATTHMAWKPEHATDTAPKPMGNWGWAVRLGEIIGFVGGGLIIPAAMMKVPYCDNCHMYMKTKSVALIPASAPLRRAKNDSEMQAAYNAATEQLKKFDDFLRAGDAASFRNELAAVAPERKAAKKLPRRIELKLCHCKMCAAGKLKIDLLTGQGKRLQRQNIATQDTPPEFVRECLRQA